uniref:Membrane protein UL124 n=1 Tax=Mastomys natalensis cytomegalovirus 1 TaxID=2973541 RepID=A0A9Y1IQJ6_9BETA|nr:membrane protein UL124 [Mastomys natalensis cytomegalovirus 1]WEG68978.1 membrane protein UL124 [Mastomys natalensis cytomegalovirus 1]WEG71206.1 membrane protein UL124 [Mastomys natalensis cytomegalovirus 1]
MAYTWINTTKYGVLIIGAILLCYVYGGYIKDIMESIPGHRKMIYTSIRERRGIKTMNITRKVEGSSGEEYGKRAKWVQPLSTIFSILFMFGFIMAAVACNVWCMGGDDLSSHGDSIMDIEMASTADPTD